MHVGARLGSIALIAFGGVTAAHADMRQCSEHRVDYLVGGVGKNGGGGRTCGVALATTPAPAAARGPSGAGASLGRTMTPDDEGRREILQQELDKARSALSELDKNPVPIPGAGTLAEQRARRVSDISSLEAELGRLKR